jgi:glucose-fructose oxidoreductase
MLTGTLRFPGERLATFTCSFGSAAADWCEVVGTKGRLRLGPIFDVGQELRHELTVGGKTKLSRFKKRDQFGPELLYFSDCIRNDRVPEPSGWEGLNDIEIIEALYQAAQTGTVVRLENLIRKPQPSLEQQIDRPAAPKVRLVHVRKPSAA